MPDRQKLDASIRVVAEALDLGKTALDRSGVPQTIAIPEWPRSLDARVQQSKPPTPDESRLEAPPITLDPPTGTFSNLEAWNRSNSIESDSELTTQGDGSPSTTAEDRDPVRPRASTDSRLSARAGTSAPTRFAPSPSIASPGAEVSSPGSLRTTPDSPALSQVVANIPSNLEAFDHNQDGSPAFSGGSASTDRLISLFNEGQRDPRLSARGDQKPLATPFVSPALAPGLAGSSQGPVDEPGSGNFDATQQARTGVTHSGLVSDRLTVGVNPDNSPIDLIRNLGSADSGMPSSPDGSSAGSGRFSGAGDSIGRVEGAGSFAGSSSAAEASSIDLTRTNELLQQILDAVRRQRGSALPVGGSSDYSER